MISPPPGAGLSSRDRIGMTLVAPRICGLLFVGVGPKSCATNEPHLTKSPLSQMGQVALTLTRHISDQQCTGRWKVIRIAVGAAFEGGEVGLAHAFLLQVAPTQSRAVAEPARPRSQPLRRKALCGDLGRAKGAASGSSYPPFALRYGLPARPRRADLQITSSELIFGMLLLNVPMMFVRQAGGPRAEISQWPVGCWPRRQSRSIVVHGICPTRCPQYERVS